MAFSLEDLIFAGLRDVLASSLRPSTGLKLRSCSVSLRDAFGRQIFTRQARQDAIPWPEELTATPHWLNGLKGVMLSFLWKTTTDEIFVLLAQHAPQRQTETEQLFEACTDQVIRNPPESVEDAVRCPFSRHAFVIASFLQVVKIQWLRGFWRFRRMRMHWRWLAPVCRKLLSNVHIAPFEQDAFRYELCDDIVDTFHSFEDATSDFNYEMWNLGVRLVRKLIRCNVRAPAQTDLSQQSFLPQRLTSSRAPKLSRSTSVPANSFKPPARNSCSSLPNDSGAADNTAHQRKLLAYAIEQACHPVGHNWWWLWMVRIMVEAGAPLEPRGSRVPSMLVVAVRAGAKPRQVGRARQLPPAGHVAIVCALLVALHGHRRDAAISHLRCGLAKVKQKEVKLPCGTVAAVERMFAAGKVMATTQRVLEQMEQWRDRYVWRQAR